MESAKLTDKERFIMNAARSNTEESQFLKKLTLIFFMNKLQSLYGDFYEFSFDFFINFIYSKC